MKKSPIMTLAAVVFIGLSTTGTAHAVSPADTAARTTTTAGKVVKGSYVVTLKDGVDPRGLARALAVSPRYVYDEALRGFTAKLSPGQLKVLERRPEVERIEEEQVVIVKPPSPPVIQPGPVPTAPGSSQSTPPGSGMHGLDRIDQRSLPLSGTYSYDSKAPDVTVYVIDSGISSSHPDFGGRAANVFDVDGGDGEDCNGHGTHVAGIIGGAVHGVAKGVHLRGLQVTDCAGAGATGGIVAALDWVAANAEKPAVVNMSLTLAASPVLNAATESLAMSGISVAVAAGNSGVDACSYSPASADAVVAVAATTIDDDQASFSNAGACVDIYAPGVGVKSTWLDGSTREMSGTSMAAPHVAGAMALYKASGDRSTADVNGWLIGSATPGVVNGSGVGTPNLLLFTGAP